MQCSLRKGYSQCRCSLRKGYRQCRCSLRNRYSQCSVASAKGTASAGVASAKGTDCAGVASAKGTDSAGVASAKGTDSAGVAKVTALAATTIHPIGAAHRLNMELDLQSKFRPYVHGCIHWLRPCNPSPPPHLGSYTRALLVIQDRRHLFVTPWCSLHPEISRSNVKQLKLVP